MKNKIHLVDISNVVYHTKHPIFYLLKYFPKYPGPIFMLKKVTMVVSFEPHDWFKLTIVYIFQACYWLMLTITSSL